VLVLALLLLPAQHVSTRVLLLAAGAHAAQVLRSRRRAAVLFQAPVSSMVRIRPAPTQRTVRGSSPPRCARTTLMWLNGFYAPVQPLRGHHFRFVCPSSAPPAVSGLQHERRERRKAGVGIGFWVGLRTSHTQLKRQLHPPPLRRVSPAYSFPLCITAHAPPPNPAKQTFKYNALEALLLVTSMFILLAGMTFQSGVTDTGSSGHAALTYLVALVLVSCVGVFAGMLALEVWNSVKFARRRRRMTVLLAATPRDTVGDEDFGSSPSASAQTGPRPDAGTVQAGGAAQAGGSLSPAVASLVTRMNRATNVRAWTTNPLAGAGRVKRVKVGAVLRRPIALRTWGRGCYICLLPLPVDVAWLHRGRAEGAGGAGHGELRLRAPHPLDLVLVHLFTVVVGALVCPRSCASGGVGRPSRSACSRQPTL
jgi:hypothetical protein